VAFPSGAAQYVLYRAQYTRTELIFHRPSMCYMKCAFACLLPAEAQRAGRPTCNQEVARFDFRSARGRVRANSITSTGNSKKRRPPEKPAACRTHLSSPSPTTVKLSCESRLMITAYREVNIWNGLFSCPHTSTMMTKFLNLGAPVPTPLLNFTFSIGATCRLCGANKFKFKVPL